jgi:N-acyl-D-aspartate/D-glutamate deacylase
MNLETAIRKITALPAQTFGIHERGILRKGAFADITVFDYKKIMDRATFEDPFLKPGGIRYVFVNGVPVVREGEITGTRPGRVLRHGR